MLDVFSSRGAGGAVVWNVDRVVGSGRSFATLEEGIQLRKLVIKSSVLASRLRSEIEHDTLAESFPSVFGNGG